VWSERVPLELPQLVLEQPVQPARPQPLLLLERQREPKAQAQR